MLLSILVFVFGFSAQAAPITSAQEQKTLVDVLSGSVPLGNGGFPSTLNHRFSDSFEIHAAAQYLKEQYDAAGISAEVLQYNPMEAFPHYFQSMNATYRSYFQHLIPMLQTDFDGLCADTLQPAQKEKVLQRLKRVGLEKGSLCAIVSKDRVEKYISTTIAHTTDVTKKMLEGRTEPTWPNVMAIVPTSLSQGEAGARPLCVFGAHMDSVVREGGGRGPIASPVLYAPGADDNASGTAAVLTLGRALRDWIKTDQPALKCDLAFVHFSGEEEGLLGSLAFVHLQTNRPISMMINFDMIAYNASHEHILNIGYDKRFGRQMSEAFVFERSPLKTVIVERDTFIYSSDQISFWEMGIPAVAVSEQACSTSACKDPFKHFNPYLHTPDDTAARLDFDYAASVIEHSFQAARALLK